MRKCEENVFANQIFQRRKKTDFYIAPKTGIFNQTQFKYIFSLSLIGNVIYFKKLDLLRALIFSFNYKINILG